MNSQQKKYALNRINELVMGKEIAANRKYVVAAKTISFEEKYKLIKAGKVSLRPLSELYRYTDLQDAYDFSKHETQSGYSSGHDKVVNQIRSKGQEAKDQIMLGDSEEALRLIKEIENISI